MDWINIELESRGWSQRELARRSRLSSTTISKIISGHAKPGWDFCVAIAKPLEVSPEKLFQLAGLLPSKPEEDEGIDGEEMLREIYEAVVKESPVDRLAEAKTMYLADDTTAEELLKVVKDLSHRERVELLKFAYYLRDTSSSGGDKTLPASANA